MRRYQEGGPVQTMVDPNTGELVFGQIINGYMVPVGPAGAPAAQLDPQRAAALIRAAETGLAERSQRMIEMMGEMGMKGAISDREMQMLEQAAFGSSDPPGVRGLKERIRERMETRPLTSGQMRRMLDAGVEPEEIEAEQIERSYNTTGRGGRIETHANGALEWVPNGPGDIPQPPIGDVFYDPIEEHGREIETERLLEQLRMRD